MKLNPRGRTRPAALRVGAHPARTHRASHAGHPRAAQSRFRSPRSLFDVAPVALLTKTRLRAFEEVWEPSFIPKKTLFCKIKVKKLCSTTYCDFFFLFCFES